METDPAVEDAGRVERFDPELVLPSMLAQLEREMLRWAFPFSLISSDSRGFNTASSRDNAVSFWRSPAINLRSLFSLVEILEHNRARAVVTQRAMLDSIGPLSNSRDRL